MQDFKLVFLILYGQDLDLVVLKLKIKVPEGIETILLREKTKVLEDASIGQKQIVI